ncbi:MAG: YMGG-like glycine zipper-containing protein [Desulfobaccales bacterium]|jgi:hypothetical protein
MLKTVGVLLLVVMLLGGCAGSAFDTTSAERTGVGGLIGAGSGALIGAAAGNPAAGAAIGAGAGLLGGYIYDQYQKSHGN